MNTEQTPQLQPQKFKVPGEIVNQSTQVLPDDQRSAIRWLHAYAVDNDLPLAEVSRLVRYDESTIHRIFYGKYEGNIANVCQEIVSFRNHHEEHKAGKKREFIETSLSSKIWRVCDAALEFQRFAFIFGDSQIGKTAALRKYQADHNHGQTIYTSMPTGGSLSHLLPQLAISMRISPVQHERELWRKIIAAFDDRMLLIVDECHQVLRGSETTRAMRSMEFIREIHDRSGCGVVICATNIFRDEMENGRSAGILVQSRRRRLCALQLPNVPPRADLDIFAAAYGLPPADGDALNMQTEVTRSEALGMWITILRMGAKLACRKGKPMSWQYVMAAYTALKSLEQ